MVGNEDGSWCHAVFLGDLGEVRIGEQGRVGGSKRAVGFKKDATLVTPRFEVMLGVERVELNPEVSDVGERNSLVDGGDNLPCLLQLLEIGNRPVGNTDGLDLALSEDLLHLLPCLALIPRAVDGARAIRVGREQGGSLVGNEAAVGQRCW